MTPGAPPGPWVEVAVGVIERPDGQVLLGQRLAGKPYAGWWEFPGGKVESGESVERALARELHEEIGLESVRSLPWVVRTHRYAHADVRLHFRRVFEWSGEPRGREGQSLAWRYAAAIDLAPLLPATVSPIAWLRLPAIYAVSCASEIGLSRFVERLTGLLEGFQPDQPPKGAVMLQLREPELPETDFARLFGQIRALRRHFPLKVLVSSRHALSYAAAVDGLHLTARDLAASAGRPRLPWVAASCHTAAELERAAACGCDFAVLGPVQATASHPGAQGLGWAEFARQVAATPLPVYAIGGLQADDLVSARQSGAHGVALMRAFWT